MKVTKLQQKVKTLKEKLKETQVQSFAQAASATKPEGSANVQFITNRISNLHRALEASQSTVAKLTNRVKVLETELSQAYLARETTDRLQRVGKLHSCRSLKFIV
jgi:hypothetical protein